VLHVVSPGISSLFSLGFFVRVPDLLVPVKYFVAFEGEFEEVEIKVDNVLQQVLLEIVLFISFIRLFDKGIKTVVYLLGESTSAHFVLSDIWLP
jgi:hypothetical protein